MRSSRTCMTSVGTCTRGAIRAHRDLRRLRRSEQRIQVMWSSGEGQLNQSACSFVPSGMNCEVNICRNAGSSMPHPSAHQSCHRFSFLMFPWRSLAAAQRKTTIQDQMRRCARDTHGISNGGGQPCETPKSGKRSIPTPIGPRFQCRQPMPQEKAHRRSQSDSPLPRASYRIGV